MDDYSILKKTGFPTTYTIKESQCIYIPPCRNLNIVLRGAGGGGAGALFDQSGNIRYSGGGGGGGCGECIGLKFKTSYDPLFCKIRVGRGGKHGIGGNTNQVTNGENGGDSKICISNTSDSGSVRTSDSGSVRKKYKAMGGGGGFIAINSQTGGNGGKGGGGGGGGYFMGGIGGIYYDCGLNGVNGQKYDLNNGMLMKGGDGALNPNSGGAGTVISESGIHYLIGGGGGGACVCGGKGGDCGPLPGGNGQDVGCGGGGGAGFNLHSVNGADGGDGGHGLVTITFNPIIFERTKRKCEKIKRRK